jgi:NlpC/P60 family putative phage cell wall peptidase
MAISLSRQRVVDAAMPWLGTPYRHQASLQSVGADCLGLVRGVWRELYGSEPEAMPAYTADWAEARGTETMAEAAGRHMAAIPVDAARTGDLILFRWRAGLPAKHAAILVAPERFIHAHDGAAVALASLSPWWRRRIGFAFSFPGVTD